MFDYSTNKYIFLDIDGVMNNEFDMLSKKEEGADYYDALFDEFAWSRLGDLCKKTNAKIVLSSSWRHAVKFTADNRVITDYSHDSLTAKLIQHFNDYNIPLVGCTSTAFDGCRGKQILDYVLTNFHGLEDEWIVLDDEVFDMEEHLPMDHIFKTSFKTGLTDEICRDILKFWGWDESVHVYFCDEAFCDINEPLDAAPNGVLILQGARGFKRNYLQYCEKACYNQDHGAPLYIVTNIPYFLEKAYWNGESFNAYIWSEKDECYHNVQEYADRELCGGHNLHALYVNGHLTDHWSR